jgi:hypothetical protein
MLSRILALVHGGGLAVLAPVRTAGADAPISDVVALAIDSFVAGQMRPDHERLSDLLSVAQR